MVWSRVGPGFPAGDEHGLAHTGITDWDRESGSGRRGEVVACRKVTGIYRVENRSVFGCIDTVLIWYCLLSDREEQEVYWYTDGGEEREDADRVENIE